jgi:FkbM family methyltransferase
MNPTEPDIRLTLHHVGGRGGGGGFPSLPNFERDFTTILYDADPNCVEQATQMASGSGAQTLVLPYCLGRAPEETSFNITYDPYASSLLELNDAYGEYYYHTHDGHDYVVGETLKTAETIALRTVTLDSLVDSGAVPAPDFLSLDTQGSEKDILEGSTRCLAGRTLGLILEVEFHELYKGQALFGSIAEMLKDAGFHFVDFLHLGHLAPSRRKSGLRGKGFLAYGDALFLRDLSTLGPRAWAQDERSRRVALDKLAFLSVVFHQMEYALMCIDARPVLSDWRSSAPGYLRFIDELARIARTAGGRLPPTFADVYSYAESKARFAPTAQLRPTLRRRVVSTLERVPAANALYRSWRDCLRDSLRLFTTVRSALHGYSAVETHLVRNGLYPQANVLREQRVRLGA